jgi:hypothetical protein
MKLQKLLNGRSPGGSPVPMERKHQAAVDVQPKDDVSEPVQGTQRIQQPTQYDVLFGRGKPYQGHKGNIRLHKVVDLYKPRYSQARRHEKTEIAEEIVQFVKVSGEKAGRFLKRAEGDEAWVEVSDSIARDKVSHALRGKPRKEASSPKSQTPSLMEELAAPKRYFASQRPSEQAKRQKLSQPSPAELELLAAQRTSSSMIAPLSSSSALLSAASAAGMDLQSRLFAAALFDRHLGLAPPVNTQLGGLARFLGNGHASTPSLLGNEVDLLQALRAERSLRSDPRLWY